MSKLILSHYPPTPSLLPAILTCILTHLLIHPSTCWYPTHLSSDHLPQPFQPSCLCSHLPIYQPIINSTISPFSISFHWSSHLTPSHSPIHLPAHPVFHSFTHQTHLFTLHLPVYQHSHKPTTHPSIPPVPHPPSLLLPSPHPTSLSPSIYWPIHPRPTHPTFTEDLLWARHCGQCWEHLTAVWDSCGGEALCLQRWGLLTSALWKRSASSDLTAVWCVSVGWREPMLNWLHLCLLPGVVIPWWHVN